MNFGPKITNDGLVFGYDTGYGIVNNNTIDRYNLGEPTTNLANTDYKRTLYIHRPESYFHTGSVSDAPERGDGWKKIEIETIGTNFRLAQFPYITYNTDNPTRIYSIEYDFNGNSGYYWRTDGVGYNGNVTDDGQRWSVLNESGSALTGSYAIFLNNNNTNRVGINETIYYRYYQIEEKSHSTPFTPTSRSTSGSLLDLTGNSIIDLNNVSFDSNSQMYFDGVSNNITISNFSYLNNINTASVEFLFKRNTISDKYLIWANGLILIQMFTNDTSRVRWFNFGLTWGNTGTIVGTGNINYQHLIITYNNGNVIAYVNGVESTSYVDTGTAVSFVNVPIILGNRDASFIDGDIPVVRIYDRGLSPQEVQQNYTSYKNRFNLS